ncbi:DUF167 domain-containing protein [Nitrogeniibacter aestuarii]|uniref:DUF167 domain-containing protein n=1 Tax=Nitrogeniibacter aestuarii TaxID=2815343 RepID=UPI001E342837|nr:DUF167 domain-containing protein [Nitrogeniibacter aestuarii]
MQVSADEVVLRLHIQPGAKTSGFAGRHGDAMKLRLAAPPVDGKANKALLAYLADFCGLPKSKVELVSGHTSRAKRVRLSGLSVSGLGRLKDLD